MYRLICFFLLISISLHCDARKERFWVLGSYAIKANAEAEQMRLAEALSANVIIRSNTTREVFRVMVNAADVSKEMLLQLDIESWLLPVEVPDVAAMADHEEPAEEPVQSVPEQAEPEDPPELPEEEPRPLYPEILLGESLADYCTRHPESRLCRHSAIEFFIEREGIIAKGKDGLEERCRAISDVPIAEICRQWRLAHQ